MFLMHQEHDGSSDFIAEERIIVVSDDTISLCRRGGTTDAMGRLKLGPDVRLRIR
jgi:hypothetical protein